TMSVAPSMTQAREANQPTRSSLTAPEGLVRESTISICTASRLALGVLWINERTTQQIGDRCTDVHSPRLTIGITIWSPRRRTGFTGGEPTVMKREHGRGHKSSSPWL